MLVVIGPSGGGKSSAVRELAAAGLVWVHPTWTTRPPRADEAQGSLEHEFVDEEEFSRLERDGFFLGSVQMFGLRHRYGLPDPRSRRRPHPQPSTGNPGPVDLVMLRAPLLGEMARHFPELVTYQITATRADAESRLIERGLGDAELAARLADNVPECALGAEVADRCFLSSGSLADLRAQLMAAIRDDFGVEPAGTE